MLAILCLVSLFFPTLWAQKLVKCPYKNICQLALLSKNDVILHCDSDDVFWYFSSSLKGDLSPISSINNIKVLPENSLQLENPQPFQSGLYRCLDTHKTRVVEYEIDFQDVTLMHISHKDLGQKPLENLTLNLDGQVLIFTHWEPWQDCNRCLRAGERKRLGYCYVQEPSEKATPCWLYMREKVINSRLRPELQVQACHVPCDSSRETTQPYFVYNVRELDGSPESTWLRCPLASIYRPVQWEVNDTALTWLDQLSGRELRTSMNLLSGGQWLQIFQPGTYRCFVEQELVAQFNPAPVEMLEPEGGTKAQKWQPRKIQAPPDKAESVLRGLKLTLLLGFVLMMVGLLGLLYKIFPPARGKRRSQLLLVK